jgi:hypothetical protein
MIPLFTLMAVLPLLAVASLPTWPYSTRWTYVPSATLSALTVSLLLLIISGRL